MLNSPLTREKAHLDTKDLIIDGVRTSVHDSGPSDQDEAVVFVHGNPGPSDDWEDLAPYVAEFARVVAPDMPGFGRSARPRDFRYTIAGYAQHLGRLLDTLGVERVHLVLHDFGGAWGLAWARSHPGRLKSLTLVNCGIMPGYRWHRFARVWQTPVVGELFQLAANARALRAALNSANPKPFPEAFISRIASFADWGHKRAVLKLYRSARDLDAHYPPPTTEEREAFASLPTCVLWGAADTYLPIVYADKQKEFFRSAEVHPLAGLGHWPFIDDAEAVRKPLLAFLRRQFARALE